MINRKAVLAKYKNRCAYCGKDLTLKTMQVDHIYPKRLGGTDDFDNLNPSCQRCNHYKRGNTLEDFRKQLESLPQRLNKIYIYKVAVDHGFVQTKSFSVGFYFELYNKTKERK